MNAQVKLGFIYLKGSVVPKNEQEAYRWFDKATGTDKKVYRAYAAVQIAGLYRNDKWGVVDYAQALKWYQKAVDWGGATGAAAEGINSMYAMGQGVPKDMARAEKGYREQADSGNPGAIFNLAEKYESGKEFPKDLAEAKKWYQMLADGGNPIAQVKLYEISNYGSSSPQDDPETLKQDQTAADSGDAVAMLRMGQRCEMGLGVTKDVAMAMNWFQK